MYKSFLTRISMVVSLSPNPSYPQPVNGNQSHPLPEEASQFIKLNQKYLVPDRAAGFALFRYIPARKRFVLFKNEGEPIRADQLETLTHEGRQPVFVPVAHASALTFYLSENLVDLVNDPSIPIEVKVEEVNTLALAVMKNLFDTPPDMREFIATAANVSRSITILLLSQPVAMNLLNRLRSYDYYTYSHSLNVCVMGMGLFLRLHPRATPSQVEDLTRGLLLHDIGKCDIPRELTNKPGRLTEAEWQIMRSHPVKGYERLEHDETLSPDSHLIALYHHEAMDGSGYPEGIRRGSIPLTSRLCKVVDVYDALTSNRSYKQRMTPFDALVLMTRDMKTQIDQDLMKEFILFLDHMGKLTVRKPL